MNNHVHLDNVVCEFINNLNNNEMKPIYEMSADDARRFLVEVQENGYQDLQSSVEDISIFNTFVGDISVRLVKSESCKDEILPLIVYCHGGGWVMGDADVFDMTIKTIAEHTKSAVAFINYSRAPEFKYPVALNQIYETVKYFWKNGANYKINPERIAIAGDSAGGNLAIATAIKLNYEDELKLCFLALIYPVCDADMNTKSYSEFKDGPWLSKKAMEYFFDAYLENKKQRQEISVSPLKAEIDDLAGLPPTLIITAENDVLRDEGEEFAQKLIKAGVDTACVRINNTIHDFILLNSLRKSRANKTTYKLICTALKHALYK